MGLFKLHNGDLCSLVYLKSKFKFKSRLPIPEFSGYHCLMCFFLFKQEIVKTVIS